MRHNSLLSSILSFISSYALPSYFITFFSSLLSIVLQIEDDTDRDNFLNPWEAKEYGLVDAVIDDGKPGLVAPITDVTPPPKTEIWHMWKVDGSKQAKKNLPTEHIFLQNGSVRVPKTNE